MLRLRGTEIFGSGMCDRTAGFYQVLSVFVVLSVSVESAMECQMSCLMKCFLRCVFGRYDAVCHVGATRNPGRCGGCARFQTPADVCKHWRLCSTARLQSRR